MNKLLGRTILVLHHGVADARLIGEILCRVRKEREDRMLALESLDKRFHRLRKHRILRPACHHFVGVVGKNRKNLRAVRRSQVRAASAHSHFSFARGAPVAQIFKNFRAECFH